MRKENRKFHNFRRGHHDAATNMIRFSTTVLLFLKAVTGQQCVPIEDTCPPTTLPRDSECAITRDDSGAALDVLYLNHHPDVTYRNALYYQWLRDVLLVGNPIYADLSKEEQRISVLKRVPQLAKVHNRRRCYGHSARTFISLTSRWTR